MYVQLSAEITGADGIAYTDRMHPEIQAAARIAEVTCDHCGKPTIGKALCPDCLAIWNTEPVDAANGEAVA